MKQITDELFLELIKFFLIGEETADREYIEQELDKKLHAAARRQEYTERLILERKNTAP